MLKNLPTARSLSQLYQDLTKSTPNHWRFGWWKHWERGKALVFLPRPHCHPSRSRLQSRLIWRFSASFYRDTSVVPIKSRPVDGHISATPAFHHSFHTRLCSIFDFYRSELSILKFPPFSPKKSLTATNSIHVNYLMVCNIFYFCSVYFMDNYFCLPKN